MIDPQTITGPTAAFLAGVVTSVHCVGMCGPLACAFLPQGEDKANPIVVTSVYHGARVFAYTLLGAIAGAVGAAPFTWFDTSSLHFFPWALVIFFVAVAFGLEKRIPKPKFVSKWFFKLNLKFRKLPRTFAGGLLGLVTPFLPCGPLYLVLGVALMTGSMTNGAQFLFAFALGTLPLIWLTHTQYARIQTRISPIWMKRIQRGMALILAAMIAWRLYAGPDLVQMPDGSMENCPFCF
ncbi:sulfite exporter TauE/SafE family protein [Puniceicoccus vermicola]|uniref:Sulfite exporter TauE/SafE family protein n=1 Tax=Puniceicoccus vermicola TaxID=388746 RepID=A0A7X1B030_9BACT|nr:sulfite exporter TauE/SafE family protein [Puniceicoccus vermicola]MBC2602025.1 sulfite exporter TauE/SafE family protein [Puniceicoccus vermicola]